MTNRTSRRRWPGVPPVEVHAGAAELRVIATLDSYDEGEWARLAGVSKSTLRQWLRLKQCLPGPAAWARLEPRLDELRAEAGTLTAEGLTEVLEQVLPSERESVEPVFRRWLRKDKKRRSPPNWNTG